VKTIRNAIVEGWLGRKDDYHACRCHGPAEGKVLCPCVERAVRHAGCIVVPPLSAIAPTEAPQPQAAE